MLIRETFPVGLLACNCTILGDDASREAIVIDPGADVSIILTVLARHQLTVKTIVVTHAHIDHIAGAQSLKQVTGAPVLYNKSDLPLVAVMDMQADMFHLPVPDVRPPDHSPQDGEHITVRGIDATILHTPGHSEGSMCLHIPSEKLLISGDTIFAGSIGRTDLPGGDMGQILSSIHERLMPLDDDTLVVPGHGRTTTIARERMTNPFLQTGFEA